MLNKVIIMGRITADIVMKKTNSDKDYKWQTLATAAAYYSYD